jgi:hypothetical protein
MTVSVLLREFLWRYVIVSQNTPPLAIIALLGCTVFVVGTLISMPVQNAPGNGFPDDWTHHHLVFSNPGTLQDAIKNGTYDHWIRTVTDPRYRIQQMKRASGAAPPDDQIIIGGGLRTKHLLHDDWTVTLSGGGNNSVAADMYAAKYSFSPIGNPDCVNDFVVYPITAAGNSGNQANLVGVKNLYVTTCTGTVPTVSFAYFIGTGNVQTSPVLSLDGKKVAFVESSATSIFHVLTIGTTGSNGTAFNAPAIPGTGNNAVDTKLTMSGNVNVTRSSPFVDYTNDIAYVGDDTGKVHKFTGVFNGTPAEAGSPWPFTVSTGIILTGPTYDSISGNIFVGGSAGNLWCVKSAGVPCSPPNVLVGAGPNGILDAPIVDSTNQTVFATAQTSTNLVLSQVTTAMASQVIAAMGKGGGAAQHNYNGAFDSAYFAAVSTGHMYFCGNDASADNTLLRVSFNSLGTMAGAPDSGSFSLTTAATVDCIPLTEILNTSQGKDYLFVGVHDHGFSTGSPNCGNSACIASFVLPTSSPFTFPTVANAATNTNLGTHGSSGIIIDNVSGLAGASQIYFGNLQANTGVQASQSALQ